MKSGSGLRRATAVAADAIRLLESEGIDPREIAAGFALALQRIPAAAWARKNPGAAAILRAGGELAADLVRAVRGPR